MSPYRYTSTTDSYTAERLTPLRVLVLSDFVSPGTQTVVVVLDVVVVVVVVVEWLIVLEEQLLLEMLIDGRREICVFVSRPIKIVTLPLKKGGLPKRVVDFLRRKRPIPKNNHGNRQEFRRKRLQQQRQTLEIVEDFVCEIFFEKNGDFAFVFFIFLHFSLFFLLFLSILSIFHFLNFPFFFSFSFLGCSKSDFCCGLNCFTISNTIS